MQTKLTLKEVEDLTDGSAIYKQVGAWARATCPCAKLRGSTTLHNIPLP